MWNNKDSEKIVVLLQRTQLSVYRTSTGKIVVLPLEPTLVQDLEIIDEDAFCKYLIAFIQQLKLSSASVIVVLDSSVYFTQKVADTKELPANETSKHNDPNPRLNAVAESSALENQKRVFAQSVPFANVFSTVIALGKDKFFVALNRDFYEPVIKTLSDKELKVVTILPIAVLTPIFQNGFTAEAAAMLVNTFDKYRTHNFLENSMRKDDSTVVTALPTDPSDKKRLMVMAVVFVVLIGVLVGVILWSRQRDQQDLQTVQQPAVEVASTPSAIPTPIPTVVPAPLSLSELLQSSSSGTLAGSNYTVNIISATNDSAATSTLEEQLRTVGFSQITVSEPVTIITGNMIVSIAESVSLTIQEALESQLTDWGYQPTFQSDLEQANSIEITLTDQ